MKENISNEKMKQIIDTYSQELLRICYLYGNTVDASHDIVQNVLIKVYLNYDRFRNESSEKTWITQIAINECKNHLKSSWKRRIILTNEFEETGYDHAMLSDSEDELISLIQKLPLKYKEVLILYYYEELTLKEISQILHKPLSTVGSRLKKARTLLEEKMKEEHVYEKFQRLL